MPKETPPVPPTLPYTEETEKYEDASSPTSSPLSSSCTGVGKSCFNRRINFSRALERPNDNLVEVLEKEFTSRSRKDTSGRISGRLSASLCSSSSK